MTPGPVAPRSPPNAPGVDEAALPAGHKVFEYRIEKTLGGGGFGITYLARDINLELPVALKEYFPGELTVRAADHTVHVRAPDAEQQFNWGLERFLDEARALASFRHPNIARVLRYFRDNGTAYIVMEYESGDPLKRWLARQPPLDQAALLKVIYPLLDGLEAVHKLDFLHRDIKPDNIYIRADGTPVLLDFGAARRTTGGRDLTNIVSPGFAPFEQYHSKGHQGPWSDIYSLGAVMYWMVTGEKPLESAARVQDDSLLAAQAIGNAAVFGPGLLRAIDWAMAPDEKRRPQCVAELRAALLAAERAATGLSAAGVSPPGDTRPGPASDVLAFAASAQATPGGSAEHGRKNVLGTVMSLNLVAYSRHPVAQQATLKQRFNELLDKALMGVPQASRIVIDTSDGAATCFLGDPEEALQSALLLRSLLLQKYGQMVSVRIGVHLGPIRLVFDVNQQANVLGDGINVAQRITDFAQPNQIVVSRAYYDVISRITDNANGLFSPMGPHLDKHLRSHEIYAVMEPQARPAQANAHNSEFANTASYATLSSLTPEVLVDIESELAHSIGPLAKVLVKKALPRSVGAQGLRKLLAVSIPDPKAREAFLHPKGQKTQPVGMPAFGGRPDASNRSHPDLSHPVSPSHSGTISGSISGRSAPLSSPWFSAAQLTHLERALSQVIGPLAKMLLKKHIARHTSLAALREALAGEIDHAAEREKFLAATQKLP
ncbi:MAG: protein kinase [Pseudomonadota bacterium]|uniref:protein kinase domain-containing protein n=1 Tax=Polaromonas sp. TaxID=1869339 RepID=UPI0017F56383|nr:protein kinase [Polaromonas sp.]MBA3592886.1 protein kinase [Polaromonas sp.]MDQ3273044.1 protein kinase [Pseudomonadota bacterium]